jgi:hypothetical protein
MTKSDAGQWHDIVQNSNRETVKQLLALGNALKHIRDRHLFYDLGFDYFEEYTGVVLGRGTRTADHLIRIAEVFKDIRIPAKYKNITYTKLVYLARVVTKSNAEGWFKDANEKTSTEIRAAVRKHRKRMIQSGKLRELRKANVREFTVSATTTDHEQTVIRSAIDYMKSKGAKTNGEALAKMAEKILPRARRVA